MLNNKPDLLSVHLNKGAFLFALCSLIMVFFEIDLFRSQNFSTVISGHIQQFLKKKVKEKILSLYE